MKEKKEYEELLAKLTESNIEDKEERAKHYRMKLDVIQEDINEEKAAEIEAKIKKMN